MPRTTLDLDGLVLEQLRRRGAQEGKSMGQVASELLAPSLAADAQREPPPFQWHAKDMGQPLIDTDDKDALWATLDEDRP